MHFWLARGRTKDELVDLERLLSGSSGPAGREGEWSAEAEMAAFRRAQG